VTDPRRPRLTLRLPAEELERLQRLQRLAAGGGLTTSAVARRLLALGLRQVEEAPETFLGLDGAPEVQA